MYISGHIGKNLRAVFPKKKKETAKLAHRLLFYMLCARLNVDMFQFNDFIVDRCVSSRVSCQKNIQQERV